jgi:hypothetical protein
METTIGMIYKKIGDILKEIEPVTKDKKNTQQNYNFRGIEQAVDMLSPILAKHGVFPTTENIESISSEAVQSKSGSAGYHYVNRYTFHFYAEDGSFVRTQADGEAIDYGDKSSNKAYSTAYREALWKLFVVPFQADDTENHSHDLVAPVVQYAPKAKPTKTPHESAYDAIMGVLTPEDATKVAEQITNSKKLTESEKADLMDTLQARSELI